MYHVSVVAVPVTDADVTEALVVVLDVGVVHVDYVRVVNSQSGN